jgi:hypothetical protein
MNWNKSFMMACGILALGSPLAFAQTTQTMTTTTVVKDGTMDDKMAKFKEYATPGENHRVLDQLVGSWDYTSRMWMNENAMPETSSGTAEIKWDMDGHFIQEDVKGTAMGQPFTGRNIIGYNNASKEYESVWYDNMGTGMMVTNGTYDPVSKTLSTKGEFMCPMYGHSQARWVTKFLDPRTMSFEAFMTKDGKEFRNMEIIYKRR